MSAPTPTLTRRENIGLAIAALIVVVFAAWRASVGFSLYDDSYYAVVPWRFAHGARFLVDELSLQAVGEMAAVPFVWLWERLFGLTGLVLATRLLWVALASAAGVWMWRKLRGSMASGVAAFAVALPLLCPPYHSFAMTYNTLSSLLMTVAVIAGFVAMRDGSRAYAAACGVAVVLGSAAYPPFALAGIALGVTFLIMAKDNRLRLWAVGAALVSAVVVGLALLGGVSAAQLRFAISFGGANSSSFSTPAVKLWNLVSRTSGALFGVWLIPMWLLVAIATVPLVPSRLRVWALAAIPLAAALPGALLLARGDELTFGVSAGSWLITTCAGIALPSLLAARRARRSQLLRLATLATPFTLVGYITVGYVTNSSWNRGMPAIALAPLAVALLACWATELAESGGAAAMRTGTVMALLIAGTLLSASVFGDAPLWKPHARVTSGAYAGLWAGTARVRQAEAIKQAADRWVAPGSRVTFLADPEAYLLTPGTPYTPATWLFSGRTDQAALDYFERSGALPDVVFVSDVDVKQAGGWAKAPSEDPLLATLKASYRRVGSVDGFTVFVSRGQ